MSQPAEPSLSSCDEMLRALNAYIDQDTLSALCQEFSRHLAGCHPCQIVVDNIRRTIQLYKDGQPYPVPEEFSQRLRGALERKWREKFPTL